MNPEQRLLFKQGAAAPSQAPTVQPQLDAPQIRAALEKAEEQRDVIKRLTELRGIIEGQQTAEGRLTGIEQLLKVDNTAEGRDLAEELLDAEIARDNAAKRAEVLNRSDLKLLSLRIERARDLQSTLDTKAMTAVPVPETKTDIAVLGIGKVAQDAKRTVEKTWDNMNDLIRSPNRKEIFKQMSATDKITTTAVGIGSVLVAGFAFKKLIWDKLFSKKKAESSEDSPEEKEQQSIFKSKGFWAGIAAIGVGTLAYLGLSGKYKNMAAEYAKAKAAEAKDYAKQKAAEAKEVLGEAFAGEKPWEDFNLSEADYEQAIELFQTKTNESEKELRTLIMSANSNDEVKYNEFKELMEQKFSITKVDGIDYSSYEMLKSSTEKNLAIALKNVEKFVLDHPVETTMGVLVANKIGAIKLALNVGGTVAARALAVGKAMARFGIRNPLASLFIVGSTTGTALAARQQLKNAKAPADFNEFLLAAQTGKPFFIDTTTNQPLENVTANSINSVKDKIVELASYGTDIAGIIAKGTAELADDILTSGYELAQTTKPEEIVDRNRGSFAEISSVLEIMGLTESGKKDKDQSKINDINQAITSLEAYEVVFAQEREFGFAPTSQSVDALKQLESDLKKIGLNIKIEDGIVSVELPDGTIKDLSIDPSITDEEQAFDLSNQLDIEQGLATRIFFSALQEVRLKQGEYAEGAETRTEGIMGMAIGNALYIYDPENIGEYFVYNFKTAEELYKLTTGDGDLNELGRVTGGALATNGMFTVSAALLGKIKNATIGGGSKPWPKSWLKKAARLAKDAPGINPITQTRRLLKALEDVAEFKSIARYQMQNGAKFTRAISIAKDANTVFAKAGIRPHWVRMIEHGSVAEQIKYLKKIPAKEVGKHTELITALEKGDPEALNKIRAYIKGLLGNVSSGSTDLYESVVSSTSKVRPTAGGRLAKTVDATKEIVVSAAKKLEPVYDAMRSALKAGQNSKVVKLLTENLDVFVKAAKTSKSAKAFAKIGTWLKIGGKGVARKLPLIGVIAEGVFAGLTWQEIQAAQVAGNKDKAATLQTKLNNQVGVATTFVVAPLALKTVSSSALGSAGAYTGIGAVAIIGAQVYTEYVYDSIATWQTTSKEWRNLGQEALVEKMKQYTLGYTEMGHRAAHGYTGAWALWRTMRSVTDGGTEANKAEDEKQYKGIEGINKNVRTELLTAYFLNSLEGKIYKKEGESDQDVKERASKMVNDRLTYIRNMTQGTYYVGGGRTQALLDEANKYGELMNLKRELEEKKESTTIEIIYEGEPTTIDLDALQRMTSSNSTDKPILEGAITKNIASFAKDPMIAIAVFTKFETDMQSAFEEIEDIEIDTE